MKLRTNLEKHKYYADLISDKTIVFLEQNKPHPIVFYEVYPSGKLNEYPVLEVFYYDRQYHTAYFSKKPTNADVTKAIESWRSIEFKKENIRLRYDHYNSKSLKEISESKWLTLDKSEAELLSKSILEKIAVENELLQNGHTRCQRCQKVVPDSEILESKITSYATYGSAGRIMKFCGGTCAMHEQFAHEG